MAESKEELRSLLINVKEKSEKIDLKLNILKIKIIASSLITSWQIDGEIVATWQTLFWEAPKSLQVVNAAMELKDACSLGKKAMTNLDSILKSRDITLPAKIHLIKAMVFPVVMYGCESWTIMKAEQQRIQKQKGRLFRVLWTARRSNPKGNQSWIFFGRTDAEAKIPILWLLNIKKRLIEKDLMLGKIEGGRRRGWQRMRRLDGITVDLMDRNLTKLRELMIDREAWCSAVHSITKSWTWMSDWTELNWTWSWG